MYKETGTPGTVSPEYFLVNNRQSFLRTGRLFVFFDAFKDKSD